MTGRRPAAIAIAALALVGAAGCGSSNSSSDTATHPADTVTRTVTTPQTSASAPTTSSTPSTQTSSHATPTAPASATVPDRTTSSPSTSGGASAPPSSGGSGGGLSAAEAKVHSLGYTPSVTYAYKPSNTLGVILGTNGAHQWAFFFVNGRYIGTDTSAPSAGIAVVGQSDTSVTLRYALYDKGAPVSSPSSYANVTYTLNDGKLEPQGPIPSAAERS